MPKFVKYGSMTFESDFLFGSDEEGATVKFSRAERLLLIKFTQSPKSVLSRDELLDVVSGVGSEAADRNIDFVINRLRRKLKDNARKPAYIATQYGEGYVWVAEQAALSTRSAGAFLVVGPVRGIGHVGTFAALAQSYAEKLHDSLDRKTAKDSKVVLDADCPPAEQFVGEKPRFAAELSFVNIGSRLDCAITLKQFATGQILRVSRHTVAEGAPAAAAVDPKRVEAAAHEITTAIWDTLTYRAGAVPTPSDEPLAVRMHDAANLLADTASWMETERRLRSALEANPNDHRAKLMLATCIHSKYLTSGPLLLPQHDFRAQDEDEMERLVLSSLPHLQDNPIFMMAAGKLLYFIDRGHRPLAIKIVEDAYQSTVAFATSFAILGQIRMLEGDFEGAMSLYDQGLELCRDGTEFQIYLLVLKCQALLAFDQRKALADALEVLYAKKPGTREVLSIFFAPPNADEIAPEVHLVLDRLDQSRARAMLVYVNYICARLFRFAEHRENILRGPLTLFVDRFGPEVVPEDVRASVPALEAALCRDQEKEAGRALRRARSGAKHERSGPKDEMRP
ncbi:MAG TPA: helix-turn-helix domain-containing protein [Xanthobacteraceae bacterium]|nr:helix-turn-helix domain-containing protein [Xanthobacteraceae bacterium]